VYINFCCAHKEDRISGYYPPRSESSWMAEVMGGGDIENNGASTESSSSKKYERGRADVGSARRTNTKNKKNNMTENFRCGVYTMPSERPIEMIKCRVSRRDSNNKAENQQIASSS